MKYRLLPCFTVSQGISTAELAANIAATLTSRVIASRETFILLSLERRKMGRNWFFTTMTGDVLASFLSTLSIYIVLSLIYDICSYWPFPSHVVSRELVGQYVSPTSDARKELHDNEDEEETTSSRHQATSSQKKPFHSQFSRSPADKTDEMRGQFWYEKTSFVAQNMN